MSWETYFKKNCHMHHFITISFEALVVYHNQIINVHKEDIHFICHVAYAKFFRVMCQIINVKCVIKTDACGIKVIVG